MTTVMVGCGGGGGGSTSAPAAGSTGGSTAAPTTTGLVPEAPARGAVLRTDATVLRPLLPGAVWSYRGTDTAYVGASPTVYASTISHTAAPGGVTEADTNGGNLGPGSIQLVVAAGAIAHQEQIDFAGKGQVESIAVVELKSPVVQNDQYTIVDRSYANTDIDADGDKVPDTLDVAIYARVIGEELLSLPNTPSLRTVRVDLAVRTRVKLSSTGALSPVVEIDVQTWYADGIGVVRQVVQEPTDAYGAMHVTDEQLTAWDGLVKGYGAMPALPAQVPADSAELAGTFLPSPATSGFVTAIRSGDHALVFTEQPFGGATGTFVSHMDARGNVLGTHRLPGLKIFLGLGALVEHAAGVNYLAAPASGTAATELTRLDSSGRLLGSTSIDLGGGRVAPLVDRLDAAADGATMWLLWPRRSVDLGVGFRYELVLRAFDTNGNALAPEIVLATDVASNPALAAGAGQVLVTWAELDPAVGYRVLYSSVTPASGAAALHTLASGASSSFVMPIAAGNPGALIWSSPLGAGTSMPHPAGVRLDGSLAPLRSSNAGLDGETLTALSAFDSTMPAPASAGGRIVATTSARDTLWPGEATDVIDTVAWIEPGTGPLATAAAHTVRSLAAGGSAAKAQVAWPDRVLLFGGMRQLETRVVWLNAPSAP